ncbi:NAD-dependent epimerase/dehydratase [Penicillium bovifimosum]|uniref:NAD-dependent epimerase/dehydratase n=1 Tax=Penicillium bovifimosum TaxID=126998 RepID=A0A9W9L5E0_9EURO|nr:NAD-dependent epimerase/dehydratase [Penicillium bovifimosum]KAJ5138256.1 NAD-dependent epimerase/dehydratase [Penicillium bovifimosum]
MSNQLIFITGATGFIGSATALAALKAGYRLRVCLRKPSEQLEALLSEYSNQVEFVTVPDITAETAFDGKLNGVDYVLHLASPLAHGTNKESHFAPAVKGTTAVLKAAAKVSSIKKVVITSSIAAFIPLTGIPAGGVIKEDNDWDFSVDEHANFEDPENPDATPMRLYMASKLLANQATWDFRATAKPHYALVTLHPAFVFGHNNVQTSADVTGTNSLLWNFIMKGDPTVNIGGVHVQDVADAQIKALDAKIVDGSKYLLAGPKMTGANVAPIVKKFYPDSGALVTEDIQGGGFPTDTTKAETELGMQWRSVETLVRDVMDQQLGFL